MENYDIWGIRFDNRQFKIGEEIPKSHRWEDGIEKDEELNGTCAYYVSDEKKFLDYLDGKLEEDYGELKRYNEAMKNPNNYTGKYIYLIASESNWGYEWGQDEGEIIMRGAEVVRMVQPLTLEKQRNVNVGMKTDKGARSAIEKKDSSTLETKKEASPKADIYSIIQAQLLMKLENAVTSEEKFSWVKPWKGAPYPCSYEHPEKPYRCPVNQLLLETGEYLTFPQIKKLHDVNPEIKIKKGCKQAYVYQYFPIFKKDENGNIQKDDQGEPVIETYRIGYTREFHVSDVTGLKSHFIAQEYEHEQTENIDMAEQLRAAYCEKYGIASEVLYGSGRAYYEKMSSRMCWPDPKQFESIYEYYSTCFHEMAHSTMEQIDRSKFTYAQEELVAEVTASLLCASLGLMDDRSYKNNVAYLQSWYGQIKKENPKGIYFAIVEAQKAAELILAACPEIEKKLRPAIEQNDIQKSEEKAESRRGEKTCRMKR